MFGGKKKKLEATKNLKKDDFKTWSPADLIEWVKHLKFEKDDKAKINKSIIKNDITGKRISKFKHENICIQFSKLDGMTQMKLYHLIRNLQSKRVLDSGFIMIFNKLFKLMGPDDSMQDIVEAASVLSDKKLFYDKYFGFYVNYFRFKESEFRILELDAKCGKDDKEMKKKIVLLSQKMEILKQTVADQYEEVTGKKFKDFNYNAFCGMKRKEKGKAWRIPCKIIITEIFSESDNVKKNLRGFLSPLVSLFPKFKTSAKFGFFHTAITVGPFYLEWNNSQVIIPKRSFGSHKAILSADIPSLVHVSFDNIEQMIKLLVKTVYNWNTKYEYAQTLDRENHLGNCQDFVDDVLDSMSIPKETLFKGMLGGYIKKLRTQGNCAFSFSPTDKFRKTFGEKKKKRSFDTHSELDTYFINLTKTLPLATIENKFREEYYFLKSLDRAFWLRYLKDETNTVCAPKIELVDGDNEAIVCPFQDPRVTQSYV